MLLVSEYFGIENCHGWIEPPCHLHGKLDVKTSWHVNEVGEGMSGTK